MAIELTFHIDPVPAARPRVTRWATYYPKKYTDFRKAMQSLLRGVPKTLLTQSLITEVIFFKKLPISMSKKQRETLCGTYCVSNMDLDNLEKALYDSLTGHVYVDDKQIVKHTTEKRWTKEGAESIWIRISTI